MSFCHHPICMLRLIRPVPLPANVQSQEGAKIYALRANFLAGKWMSFLCCFSVMRLASLWVRRRRMARVFLWRRSRGRSVESADRLTMCQMLCALVSLCLLSARRPSTAPQTTHDSVSLLHAANPHPLHTQQYAILPQACRTIRCPRSNSLGLSITRCTVHFLAACVPLS